MRHSAIKATRPQEEEAPPICEAIDCPKCHSKRNVRIIPKNSGKPNYFCTECLLEFSDKKVYSITDFKKAPSKKEKPKYEQRYRAGKRINKDWTVTKAERVISRFLELRKCMTPLEAAGKVAEEIDRDPDDVLYLIIDLAGTDWKIVPQDKPGPKKIPQHIREEMGG